MRLFKPPFLLVAAQAGSIPSVTVLQDIIVYFKRGLLAPVI